MTQKPNPTTHIQLSQISKAYPNGVQALRDINLQIAQGEIFGIIGRSGAGKSTLLRLFNRLENADSGEITIHGEHTRHYSRSQLRDLRRRVAMIFQHFNLMATKTVAQNVELPLKMAGVPRAERQKRVDEILALVGLSGFADRKPSGLSGGQQQRIALARAIVAEPRVLLFDEPLSNLDSELRESLCIEMSRLLRQLGITAVYVTHDRREAELLADKIVHLSAGCVAAVRAVSSSSGEPA